jgi:hypothetical protein
MSIQINQKNYKSGFKVKALQHFYLQGGQIARPGDVLTMSGHNLIDALNRKLVELYEETEDNPAEEKTSKKRKAKE